MVKQKQKKEKYSHANSAFSKESLEILKDITVEGFEQDLVKVLQDGLCENLEKLDRSDVGLEQICIIKNAGKQMKSLQLEQSNADNTVLHNALAFLFIRCKAKHAARQTIVSIFQSLPEHLRPAGVSSLLLSLRNELQDLESQLFTSKKVASDCFNDLLNRGVNTIMAFMENFPLGKIVICDIRDEVLGFLYIGLTREMSQLSILTSLDDRSTSMMNCLLILKATIAVLQCCKLNRQENNELNGNRTIDLLLGILKECLQITVLSEYLLDCRNASGVVTISVLQVLLSTESIRYAINRLLVINTPGDSGLYHIRSEKYLTSDCDSYSCVNKPKLATSVKDGLNGTPESVVNSDREIKNRLGKTAESIACNYSEVKDSSSKTPESTISYESDIKVRPIKTLESIIVNSQVKDGPEANSIEKQVLNILEGEFRNRDHCLISRLVIVHGVVTKLDSEVLHGVKNGTSCSIDQNESWEGPCDDSQVNTNCSQGVSNKGIFSNTLLDSLLSICSTVNEKGTTVFAFKTLFSWTVEALRHCKELKENMNLIRLRLYSPQNGITSRIIKTLNNHLDHPIDTVRHQVRNSLENVIGIINLFSDSPIHVQDLLKHWVKGSLRVRSNCMALCCIINYVKIGDILKIKNSFPKDLIDCLDDANLVSHICDLYIKSASKHRLEITDFESNYSGWVSIWCQPVFEILLCVDKTKRSSVVDYLVPGLLIAFPNLIKFILDQSKHPDHVKDYIVTSVVFLARARTLKECSKITLSQDKKENFELWHGLIRLTSLKHCLCHIDDQIRIDALSLICESNKTTQPFNNQDFDLLKFFIPLNMTNQSPLFRNQFVCSLKKAFCRMIERSKTILKRIDDLKIGEASNYGRPRDTMVELSLNEISMYTNFARWLINFLFDCLHPGASFPRKNTALEIILVFLKVVSTHDTHNCFTVLLSSDCIFTKLEITTLIGCFHDSFDTNRLLANEILSMLPRDLFTFDEHEIHCMINETLTMAKSSQTDNTNTAPYFIKLFTSENFAKPVGEALIKECSQSVECFKGGYDIQLMIGNVLLENLNEQVRKAKDNLLDAAVKAPMHGTLCCIRELLLTVSLNATKDRKSWKFFINKLIKLCFNVCDIAGPIVCSNAPEGHVISESADHNVLASHVIGNLSKDSTQSTTSNVEAQAYLSQLLLACCWRSMKEIVLILGDLASKAPVYESNSTQEEPKDTITSYDETESLSDITIIDANETSLVGSADVTSPNAISDFPAKITQPLSDTCNIDADETIAVDSTSFISTNTVIKIGRLFINILLSSRHIGAFELAYPGFVKVCSMLWKSEIQQLKMLPKKWIEDLLCELKSSKSSEAFCATRRSAGIPFYISAICSTEPVLSRRNTFKRVMTVLLEISQDASSFEEYGENEAEKTKKVIGLNILRAMFKDTKFGEDVFPYVSDGFIIAISGFSSNIWAIRNSCTLLFSALMARVFGLKKTVMSGTEFFSRFSQLYSFLLNEMKRITNTSSSQRNQLQLHPSVFPVLYLLSHLYPSSLDGNASNMNLSSFIPFINRCSDSNVYKIRAMAADALVSIVTPNQLIDILNEIISSMLISQTSEKQSHNRINGCLIKMKTLLRGKATNPGISSSLREEIIKGPLLRLNQLSWILQRNHLCSLNKAILLEIINENMFGITSEEVKSLSEKENIILFTLKSQCLACCLEELGITSSQSEYNETDVTKLQLKMIGQDLFRKQCMLVLENFSTNPRQSNAVEECVSANLELLPLLTLLENEDHDMRIFLLSFLERCVCFTSQSEAVIKILQKRLLLDEKNVECAAGICRVLSKHAPMLQFPWVISADEQYSCHEVWYVLKRKIDINQKRENIRTSFMSLFPVIVSHLLKEIYNEETPLVVQKTNSQCLKEIFNSAMESCKPEESINCRRSAAEIIGSEEFLKVVKFVNQKCCLLVTVIFDYWRCVINLLQDEEKEVRCLMARKIFLFLKDANIDETQELFSDVPTQYFIQPALVLELTIKVIAKIYSQLYPTELVEFLFSLVVGKSGPELEIALKNTKSSSLSQAYANDKGSGIMGIDFEVLGSLERRIQDFEGNLEMQVNESSSKIHHDNEAFSSAVFTQNMSSSVKEATVPSRNDITGIFEQGDSNIYMEQISIGHLAFAELQNLLALQTLPSVPINRNFIVFIWLNLKEWILDLNLFYCKESFVNSCQILMGIFLIFCFENSGIKDDIKKGLKMFCSRVDNSNSENFLQFSALYSHLKNVKILCQV